MVIIDQKIPFRFHRYCFVCFRRAQKHSRVDRCPRFIYSILKLPTQWSVTQNTTLVSNLENILVPIFYVDYPLFH